MFVYSKSRFYYPTLVVNNLFRLINLQFQLKFGLLLVFWFYKQFLELKLIFINNDVTDPIDGRISRVDKDNFMDLIKKIYGLNSIIKLTALCLFL